MVTVTMQDAHNPRDTPAMELLNEEDGDDFAVRHRDEWNFAEDIGRLTFFLSTLGDAGCLAIIDTLDSLEPDSDLPIGVLVGVFEESQQNGWGTALTDEDTDMVEYVVERSQMLEHYGIVEIDEEEHTISRGESFLSAVKLLLVVGSVTE